MPAPFPCILLHEGLAPHAVPLAGRQALKALGVNAVFPLSPEKAPLWEGPVPGRVAREGAGPPVFLCGDCSSTFDAAWELSRRGCLPPWGAVLALAQTSGRGQLRRPWHSPPGNLYVSFRLPDDAVFAHDAAPLVVGLLVQKALAALHVQTLLKWPNDILLPDGNLGAKAGGLLLEERDGTLLAGLGLNLGHTPDPAVLREAHAVPAASLPVRFAPLPLWLELASAIQRKHAALRLLPQTELMLRVETVLAWKDLPLKAKDDNSVFTGRFIGLTEKGALLLRSREGLVHCAYSGSIVPDLRCDSPEM